MEETIHIEADDNFAFNTNDSPKYSKNIRCKINYIMESSCQKIKIQCQSCRLGKGDFLIVQKGNAKPIK